MSKTSSILNFLNMSWFMHFQGEIENLWILLVLMIWPLPRSGHHSLHYHYQSQHHVFKIECGLRGSQGDHKVKSCPALLLPPIRDNNHWIHSLSIFKRMQQFVIEAELFAELKIEGRSMLQFGYILLLFCICKDYTQ